MGLLREGELTVTDITIIVVLSGTALIGAFSAVIFFLVCRKQRKTKKAMKKMHEEQMMPFVDHQNVAPAGAQIDPAETLRYSHETFGQPQYNGPLELQGSGRHEPLPPQQLDGYVAAVSFAQQKSRVWGTDVPQPTFDDARPFELPTNAVHSDKNTKSWRYK
ncbi:uncharacterized protein yc1106_06926 [Curvularia clavata]|uniref:Uncharacterized protein n=1 Tax=Curvularia clavata TaxID=95742 RepID=A0A9Q8ZCP6_CURCL|nr:uncharacterized protein yc1106_06926 [Curvularia clavata]